MTGLAGTDLDGIFHGGEEDLAVAQVAGVEGLLGRLHHDLRRDAGDNHDASTVGRRDMETGTPRYMPLPPRWAPQPMALVTVMPVMPMASRLCFRRSNR